MKKQVKKSENQSLVARSLSYGNSNGPSCKITAVVLGLLLDNPETRQEAKTYLEKWLSECTTAEGAKDIISCGYDMEHAALTELLARRGDNTQNLPTDENGILNFFQNLSPREKFLIDVWSSLCAGGNSVPSGMSIGDSLNDAILNYDLKDIPADLHWLIGARQFAEMVGNA